MNRFDRLDRADNYLAAVIRTIDRRRAPRDSVVRGREASMLVRAVKHRDRIAADLVRAGMPEGVVATRLRDRAEDRAARARAARDPRPLGRAVARAGR